MSREDKLTAKQEMFCREYLVDLNATQAAIRSGYSKNTAHVTGHENLSKPKIEQRISYLKRKREERVQFDSDEVLRRLAILSRSNINKFVKPDEYGGFVFYNNEDLTEEDMYCISEINTEEYVTQGDGNIPAIKTKIKFVDKLRALELAGRHINVQAFKEVKDINLNGSIDQRILKARNKRIGFDSKT